MRGLNELEIGLVVGGNDGYPDSPKFPGQSREEIERLLRQIEQRQIWEDIQRNHGK